MVALASAEDAGDGLTFMTSSTAARRRWILWRTSLTETRADIF